MHLVLVTGMCSMRRIPAQVTGHPADTTFAAISLRALAADLAEGY